MQNGLNLKEFVDNSTYTIFCQLWRIAMALGISVLLARGLGEKGRGVFEVALLLPTLLLNFTNFGIPTATAYYIANREVDIAIALQVNIALSLWLSVLTTIVGLGLSLFANEYLFPGVSAQLLILSLILIPFMLLNANLSAIFHGMQDFKAYNFIVLLPQFLMLILLFLLVWLLRIDVGGALMAQGVSLILTVAVLVFLIRRKTGAYLRFKLFPNREIIQKVLAFGSKSYLGNTLAFLNYRADVFLLNLFAGVGPVGIYAVSTGLAEKLWFASQSVSTVLFPKIASMKFDEQQQTQLTTMVSRNIFLLNILIGVVLFFIAEITITLLYGTKFRESALALRCLLPGVILVSISRILANDIAGRGRPGINTTHSIVALTINVVANFILIPRMGVMGAALASSISYTALTIMKVIAFCQLTSSKWYQVFLCKREDSYGWVKLFARLINLKKMDIH